MNTRMKHYSATTSVENRSQSSMRCFTAEDGVKNLFQSGQTQSSMAFLKAEKTGRRTMRYDGLSFGAMFSRPDT